MFHRMLIVVLALSMTACSSEDAATVDEEAPAPAVEMSVDDVNTDEDCPTFTDLECPLNADMDVL